MNEEPILVWFRDDLRLADHAALLAAARTGEPVVAVYVDCAVEMKPWSMGEASRWWRHQSLLRLRASLEAMGSRLIIRQGRAAVVLRRLAEETGAVGVYCHGSYEPGGIEQEKKVEGALRERGVALVRFPGHLLYEPGMVRTGDGRGYKVFTPFWRACQQLPEPEAPRGAAKSLRGLRAWPESLTVGDLGMLAGKDRAAELGGWWQVGEQAAMRRLNRFLREGLEGYEKRRDWLGVEGTSRLSAHLRHGEISVRQVWHAVRRWMRKRGQKGGEKSGWAFLRQLGWRDFAYHTLVQFPQMAEQPLREGFARLPWRSDWEGLRAWQMGRTGYPIVDAGMRELAQTGWMHNRVRMIVASFLVKDLLIAWQEGEKWFWNRLVDADVANNSFGWQWVAGCGADAAPFFRVFNPVLQGEKFDPQGQYVRRWVTELAAMENRYIHRPWEAPAEVLEKAGVMLGDNYPWPVVEHEVARDKALRAFGRVKG